MKIVQEGIMEDQELKTKIRRILIKLDFRIDLNGFDYLVSAVALAIRDERYTKNLCEKLYPKVAELHETSASCVERSIRNAISKASISSGLKKINKAGLAQTDAQVLQQIAENNRNTALAQVTQTAEAIKTNHRSCMKLSGDNHKLCKKLDKILILED